MEKQSAENERFRRTIIAALSGRFEVADDGASTLCYPDHLSDMKFENAEFADPDSADINLPTQASAWTMFMGTL